MMGFDNATSSFLALLVNKSYSKLKKEKLKTKVFNTKSFKKVQNNLLSLNFCQVTHLQDLKNVVGQ